MREQEISWTQGRKEQKRAVSDSPGEKAEMMTERTKMGPRDGPRQAHCRGGNLIIGT